jgi:hypothetical protein
MVANDSPKRTFLSLRGSPVLVFRVLLGAIMLSTGIGVLYALSDRPAFLESFPGAAEPQVYGGLLLVAGAGLVALIALWTWRRWGLLLYGVVVVASLALDRMAKAPPAHELTVCVAAVAVFSLAYLNRTRFASSGRSTTH